MGNVSRGRHRPVGRWGRVMLNDEDKAQMYTRLAASASAATRVYLVWFGDKHVLDGKAAVSQCGHVEVAFVDRFRYCKCKELGARPKYKLASKRRYTSVIG